MASPGTPVCQRRPVDGLRCLDYLEGSVRSCPEWLPHPRGVCVHGPVSKVRGNSHLVRAWVIIFIFFASAGAAIAAGLAAVIGS